MSVTVNVDETNILSLSVGQEVRVEIDSMGEEIYEGTITEIDKTGTSSDGVTRVYRKCADPKAGWNAGGNERFGQYYD